MYRVLMCLHFCFIAIDPICSRRVYISDSEYVVPEFPPGILNILKNRKENEQAIELNNEIKPPTLLKSGANIIEDVIDREVDEKDYVVPDLTLNDLFNYSVQRHTNGNKVDVKEERIIEASGNNADTKSYLEILRSSKDTIKTQFRRNPEADTGLKTLDSRKDNVKRFEDDFSTFDLDALIAESELEATKVMNDSNDKDYFRTKDTQATMKNVPTEKNKDKLIEGGKKLNDSYYEDYRNLPIKRKLSERIPIKENEVFNPHYIRTVSGISNNSSSGLDNNIASGVSNSPSEFGNEVPFPEDVYKNKNMMQNLTDAVNAMPEFKSSPKILEPKFLRVVERGDNIEVVVTEKNKVEESNLVKKMLSSPLEDLRSSMMDVYTRSKEDLLRNFDPKLVLQSPVNLELDTILKIMKADNKQQQDKPTKQDKEEGTTTMTTPKIIRSDQDATEDQELNDLIFNKFL